MPEYDIKTLKVGILGCRGLPNQYGGYEQFAQYLSEILVRRGHRVWAYCSSSHPCRRSSWRGVQRILCRDPEERLGSFGQFIYDFNCLMDARRRDYDVLLQLGYTSSAIWFPLWPGNCPNIIHMDGLEWKRAKYNIAVRWFLRKMEGWAARRGDVLVADSIAIQHHLKKTYGKEAAFISYGASADIRPDIHHLSSYGLSPKSYYLAIARFVPENQLEAIIQGYLYSEVEAPLLIIGDHGNAFGRHLLRRYGNTAIRFPGAVFQKEVLDSLRHYARMYFHGHSVGGTNPSLLEAMACRVPVCAHDNPFNRAVLEGEAFYFRDREGVSRAIEQAAASENWKEWVSRNEHKIRTAHQWEEIACRFESLFYQSLGAGAKNIKEAM